MTEPPGPGQPGPAQPGPGQSGPRQRWDTDAAGIRRDLGRLVLGIVELLRQLMERQALRRVDSGTLSEDQVEELGLALMRLEQAMAELREHFGLEPGDLDLDLGLGPLLDS